MVQRSVNRPTSGSVMVVTAAQEGFPLIEVAYPKLVAGLTFVCGSRAAAEDAAQEALARCWERSSRGDAIDSPQAWMTTVALNLARSRWRRMRAESRARARLGPPAAPPPADEVADVRRALA